MSCTDALFATFNRFLFIGTFWFLLSFWMKNVQSRYLRARRIASSRLWFLYYQLWTGFRHHNCAFFCLAYSVISVLSCTRVEVTFRSGHKCFCHLTTMKARHFKPYCRLEWQWSHFTNSTATNILSSLLLSPGQSHVLSINGEPRATSSHVPPVFLLVTLSESMSSASRLS